MRRTEQEFKEELLKRAKAYRQEQARKRKRLLGIGMCACLCYAALTVFDPFGASSDAAAPMDEMKLESVVSMQTAGSDMLADAVPAEPAAAPLAPDAGEEILAAEGSAEPREDAEALTVTILRDNDEIPLDAADSAIILDYILTGEWIPSAANCLCDYALVANGETYRYHSDCGTIQNSSGQSLPLSDADKLIFNEILQRCLDYHGS